MTYKKLETISIGGTVTAVAVFFIAAFLGGPLVHVFHLSMEQWETLFTVVKVVAVFLIGVSLGAALVEKE
jgi:hypothetical protein